MPRSLDPNRRSRSTKTVRIVLMSDTHELHREAVVPDGDILIHAGDFTMFSKRSEAIADFNDWLGELPHRHKIVIPGNHEFFLEADPLKQSMINNATLLINESIEVAALKIWGSPVTPLYGGAFGMSSPEKRRRLTMPLDNVWGFRSQQPSGCTSGKIALEGLVCFQCG